MFDFQKFSIYATGNYQFEFYSSHDGKCGVFRTSFYDVAVRTVSNWMKFGHPFELRVISIVESFDISCDQLSFLDV